MRILVGWDNPDEVDLLGTYLAVEDAESPGVVRICTTAAEVLQAARETNWDAVLVATTFPSPEQAFAVFTQLQKLLPNTPFVGAVPSSDVFRIARFLTKGLRGYLIRDTSGDFMFLARAVIDAAVQSMESERERFIAEKLREEIEAVRKLQASITPNRLQCPDGYGITARYESSQLKVIGGQPVTMAGGDYYDVFTLPDGKLALIVGDASGHGMKACMSIMTMHTLIRLLRENRYDDTAEFVSQVNRNLCQQAIVNEDGGFITLIYGVLDPATHELTWTSAGHPVPQLHDRARGVVTATAGEDASGLPLGIFDEADYTVQRTVIPPHCRLLLYTDGLIECFDVNTDNHEEFGVGGLQRTLVESNSLSLPDTLQRLFDETHAFTHGHGRHDDTSVVLLERH